MIGGEFPIAVTDILNAGSRRKNEPDVYKYASGRAALYQILKYLKSEKGVSRVLLPDYLCSSVLMPVKKLNLEYEFYPINWALELEEETFTTLYKSRAAILVINYFGLKDLTKQVSFIRSLDKDAIIIEDDVQAYYEFKKPLGDVDFKFTSLRKTFAVPDGGLVKTNCLLPVVETPNTFGQYKAAAALLKSMREGNFNDHIYLEMFEKGESIIDSELDCGMSQIAEKLYSSLDEEHIRIRRLNNSKYMVGLLIKNGVKPLLPLKEGHVPLFIPIILKNRDEVRKRMFQHEVFCPVHWPLEGMDLKRGKVMAETELSLISDQRYGQKDIDEILRIILSKS